MKFIEYRLGLYYHDADAAVQPYSNENVIDYSFVSTVANNKAQFPHRVIEGADKARALYQKIGRPSQQQFVQILAKNLIRNCPVTVVDAKRALLIYGPNVAALKGKITKGPSQHAPTFKPVQVPGFILQHHSDVKLCMDIFYVQGHPFFHTISHKVQFRTVAPVLNRNKATLLREIKLVLAMYKSRGFNISDLHANMEFECIRNDVLPSRLNVTANDDHVGEVKQSIWTMKERARTTIHGLPFKRFPKVMIQALVYHAAKGLNQFPAKNGISDTLSSLTIMTGRANPDVESADEYENFTKDNFDPTVPDNDVVDKADNHNDIEHFDNNNIGVPDDDDVGVLDDDGVDDPAVLEPYPDDFGPDDLDPDADEGAEANDDPGDEAPGDDSPDTAVEPNANED